VRQQTDVPNMATTGTFISPEAQNSSSSCDADVIMLSDAVKYAAAGTSTAFHCRAVGTSAIQWLLPGRKVGHRRKTYQKNIKKYIGLKCLK